MLRFPHSFRRPASGSWLFCFLAAGWLALPGIAAAQRPELFLESQYLTNGREVRRSFRQLVSTPRTWTVRILAGDNQVCLGTIIGEDGWILTKGSQIKGATTVELYDQQRLPFKLSGYHVGYDIALLKVEAQNLKPAVWETATPELADWVATVGTTTDPVAIGVISAPRRNIRRTISGRLGVTLKEPENTGPIIGEITEGSAAKAVGMQVGDVVLEVNGQGVSTVTQLQRAIGAFRPGDTVTIVVKRSEEQIKYTVTLGYPDEEFGSRMSIQNQMGGSLSLRRDEFEAVYQHDTVLEPEECGGPAVNLDGRAIGINIARAGRTESYILPADLLTKVLDDLKGGKHPAAASLIEGDPISVPRMRPRRPQRPE